MAMVPCLHQGNIYSKRKLRVWRDQKCILLVGGTTPLTFAGHQSTLSRGRQYKCENGKLGKLGRIYGHGTVFAPRKYSDLWPWYSVCTKEIFIPKGSYGYGEIRNVFR